MRERGDYIREYERTKRARPPGFKEERKRHRQLNRSLADQIKVLLGCADCGYNAHPSALDFDHLASRKIRPVSKMYNWSTELILDEIAGCVIRCSNCHRVRHAGLLPGFRTWCRRAISSQWFGQ